jgi:tetratricopeptide (TPR) repeat protein
MAITFPRTFLSWLVLASSLCMAQDGLGFLDALRYHPSIIEARERNEQRRPICSYRFPEAERAVAKNPRDERAWETIGRCKLKQGRADDAVAAFRRILRMNPGRGDAFSLLGHALLQTGEREYAREMFEASLRIDPNEDQAYRGLGAYHAMNGRIRDAIENYETALKLANRQGPDLFSPDEDYRTVAFLYPKLGNPKLTLMAFQRAAEVFLIDDAVNFQYGLALIAVGDRDEARVRAKMLENYGDRNLARELNSRLDGVP